MFREQRPQQKVRPTNSSSRSSSSSNWRTRPRLWRPERHHPKRRRLAKKKAVASSVGVPQKCNSAPEASQSAGSNLNRRSVCLKEGAFFKCVTVYEYCNNALIIDCEPDTEGLLRAQRQVILSREHAINDYHCTSKRISFFEIVGIFRVERNQRKVQILKAGNFYMTFSTHEKVTIARKYRVPENNSVTIPIAAFTGHKDTYIQDINRETVGTTHRAS